MRNNAVRQLTASDGLQDGKIEGEVRRDQEHPALLEAMRVLAGSHLSGVKLGQGVILDRRVDI